MDDMEAQLFADMSVRGFLAVDIVLMVLLLLVSLVGNILVASIGVWSQKLKSIPSLILLNLSISNLSVFISLPLIITCELVGASCVDLNQVLTTSHGLASGLLVCLLAVDRYIFNCGPQWIHKWSYKDAKMSICAIWIVSVGAGLTETVIELRAKEWRINVLTISDVLISAVTLGSAVVFTTTVFTMCFRACETFKLLESQEEGVEESPELNKMLLTLICVYLALPLPLYLVQQMSYWGFLGEFKSQLTLIWTCEVLAELRKAAVPLLCLGFPTKFQREFLKIVMFCIMTVKESHRVSLNQY